jgi:hypothetical protein
VVGNGRQPGHVNGSPLSSGCDRTQITDVGSADGRPAPAPTLTYVHGSWETASIMILVPPEPAVSLLCAWRH